MKLTPVLIVDSIENGMSFWVDRMGFEKTVDVPEGDHLGFVNILPRMRVLDVACGTGNLALPAARKGAQVAGVDLAANLIEQARGRAATEGLEAAFETGDAEQLPYPDGSFDLVMSMFGAMFAPRPDKIAAELCRVCRSGGVLAMANWTPDGFVGKMFRLSSRHVPPPAGLPAPSLWGDDAVVRQRFGAQVSGVQSAPRDITFDYPFGPQRVVQFFRDYFGPTQVAFSKLDAAGQKAYAADLESLWREHNEAGDGRTLIRAEYLEVIATRA